MRKRNVVRNSVRNIVSSLVFIASLTACNFESKTLSDAQAPISSATASMPDAGSSSRRPPLPTPAPRATPRATPRPQAGIPAPPAAPTPRNGARLLFKSGFEGGTTVGRASYGDWEMLSGTDGTTGFDWSKPIWGGNIGIQILTQSWQNQLQSVSGRTGQSSTALFSSMNHVDDWRSQIPLIWNPTNSISEQTDLYQSIWIKLQPDLDGQLVDGMLGPYWGNWRALWEFKTGTPNRDDGDYRIILGIKKDSNGLYWDLRGDGNAGSGLAVPEGAGFDLESRARVPAGRWFRLEVFVHRSTGADGRCWVKIDGTTIFDCSGRNMGAANMPINRWFISTVYTNGHAPAYQWVDDVELWSGFP